MSGFLHSVGRWFKLQGRKIAIKLKRNYYTIPLLAVCLCVIQFTFNLYIISPMFVRISYGDYNAIYIFVITLLGIMSTVAYLNHSGNGHSKVMLILYLIMWAVQIVLLFIILNANVMTLLA